MTRSVPPLVFLVSLCSLVCGDLSHTADRGPASSESLTLVSSGSKKFVAVVFLGLLSSALDFVTCLVAAKIPLVAVLLAYHASCDSCPYSF